MELKPNHHLYPVTVFDKSAIGTSIMREEDTGSKTKSLSNDITLLVETFCEYYELNSR